MEERYHVSRNVEDNENNLLREVNHKETKRNDYIAAECSISANFPFPTNPDDHCESPPDAYEDITPILRKLVQIKFEGVGVAKDSIVIYDPYYCNGSVIKNLSKLGFDNVHNKKEDCYADS